MTHVLLSFDPGTTDPLDHGTAQLAQRGFEAGDNGQVFGCVGGPMVAIGAILDGKRIQNAVGRQKTIDDLQRLAEAVSP